MAESYFDDTDDLEDNDDEIGALGTILAWDDDDDAAVSASVAATSSALEQQDQVTFPSGSTPTMLNSGGIGGDDSSSGFNLAQFAAEIADGGGNGQAALNITSAAPQSRRNDVAGQDQPQQQQRQTQPQQLQPQQNLLVPKQEQEQQSKDAAGNNVLPQMTLSPTPVQPVMTPSSIPTLSPFQVTSLLFQQPGQPLSLPPGMPVMSNLQHQQMQPPMQIPPQPQQQPVPLQQPQQYSFDQANFLRQMQATMQQAQLQLQQQMQPQTQQQQTQQQQAQQQQAQQQQQTQQQQLSPKPAQPQQQIQPQQQPSASQQQVQQPTPSQQATPIAPQPSSMMPTMGQILPMAGAPGAAPATIIPQLQPPAPVPAPAPQPKKKKQARRRSSTNANKTPMTTPYIAAAEPLPQTATNIVSCSDTDGETTSKRKSDDSKRQAAATSSSAVAPKATAKNQKNVKLDIDDAVAKNNASKLDTDNMSPEEKLKANRERNREHARNTRRRKKAYLENLKVQVDQMCRERDTILLERRGQAELLMEMHSTRTDVLMSFFALRSAYERRRELWASILDESCFACVMPVTPYRSFPSSEVQVSKCQRTILGIDGMMSDTASLHVLLNSLVDRSKYPNATVRFQYTLVTEDYVAAGNQMMARWVMSTLNATECGARMEVSKQGMLCCKFNSAHKIIGLELMFDVMAFMLQLRQSTGSDHFSVIPNTVQTCQRPFDTPMVMTLAERPYTIVQVNELWEEMTGYRADDVVGKASCRELQGQETNRMDVENLMSSVRYKRPASAVLVNYNRSGRRFRNYLNVYPLSTDSKITHYVGLSVHVDWMDGPLPVQAQGVAQRVARTVAQPQIANQEKQTPAIKQEPQQTSGCVVSSAATSTTTPRIQRDSTKKAGENPSIQGQPQLVMTGAASRQDSCNTGGADTVSSLTSSVSSASSRVSGSGNQSSSSSGGSSSSKQQPPPSGCKPGAQPAINSAAVVSNAMAKELILQQSTMQAPAAPTNGNAVVSTPVVANVAATAVTVASSSCSMSSQGSTSTGISTASDCAQARPKQKSQSKRKLKEGKSERQKKKGRINSGTGVVQTHNATGLPSVATSDMAPV